MSDGRAPADYAGCPITVTDALAEGRTLVAPRWGLLDALVAVAITMVLGVVAGLVIGRLTEQPGALLLVVMVLPWIGLAGWPLWATYRRGNGPRIDLGLRLTWSDTRWGLLAGVVSLVLAAIASLLTSLVVDGLTSNAAEAAQELQDVGGRGAQLLFAVGLVLGAPFAEELFFRGLLFAALRKRGVTALWTVVITAVLFAAFHFEPTRFLILLPTGIVLGWVRVKTGSTGAAMVAHGLVNAPGALVLLTGAAEMTP